MKHNTLLYLMPAVETGPDLKMFEISLSVLYIAMEIHACSNINRTGL